MVALATHAGRRGAVEIDDVVVAYRAGASRALAVDHCSLRIAAGEICAVVGPSGCGKTTLLKALAGFHGLESGAIYLDGTMLCGPGRPTAPVGPDRVVVFQNGALFPWMNNLDNVAFGPVAQKTMGRREAYDKARAMMADAGLAGYERAYPGQTSSGVKRRIEIVRALMSDPTVLLLDEPYRALDALTKSVMHEALLETYARTRVTMFFITHDLEEAVFLGHRVVVMTSRPCRPRQIVEVDLPAERDRNVVAARRFREIVGEVARSVHLEAARSFELGEKEG